MKVTYCDLCNKDLYYSIPFIEKPRFKFQQFKESQVEEKHNGQTKFRGYGWVDDKDIVYYDDVYKPLKNRIIKRKVKT